MSDALENRVFKITGTKRGAHWHLTFFSAKGPDHTYACLGTLVMDRHDFAHFPVKIKIDAGEYRLSKTTPTDVAGDPPSEADQGEGSD